MVESKFGARVYYYSDGVVLIKQTILRNGKGPYVIDEDAGGHKERHVNKGDDLGIVDGIRAAGRGELVSGGSKS